MPARTVQFEGKSFTFPDDATDDEVSQALAGIADQSRQTPPRPQPPENKIGPPEPGAGPAINRLLGRVKSGLGIGKPEGGSAPAFLGGMATGPLHMAHGVTDLPSHPIRGANEIVSGAGQTAALPLAVAAPAALPMALPYVAGGQAIQHGFKAMGADDDTSEFAGNAAAFGAGGMKAALDHDVVGKGIRGTGELLKKVGGADIPTDLPMAGRTTNMLLQAMNAAKGTVAKGGRTMSNFGVPDVTDQVHTGSPAGPLPGEPDLPTPVRPDGQPHFNDVHDQGETNRLMDEIMGRTSSEPRPATDPIRPDGSAHHDDVEPAVEPHSDTLMPDGRSLAERIQDSQTSGGPKVVPTADETPTPNSNTLLRAIQSAPGWPENGLPNKPWDDLHAEDANGELPHALSTDPYNRPDDQRIQDPSYTGPERRSPMVGSQSGADADTAAFNQARQELPDGTLSDHLMRAQQIKTQTGQTGGGSGSGGGTQQ